MKTTFMKLPVLAIALAFMARCNMQVNQPIHISDGEKINKSLNSVNGSIDVGSDCTINGSMRSVNGPISIGDGSCVQSVQSVNGSIRVKHDVTIDGDLESVNGAIDCAAGCLVDGNVQSVNGSISLEKTDVERAVTTFNGSIELKNQTKVNGNLIVKRAKGQQNYEKTLYIEIRDSSVVKGRVLVEDKQRPVVVKLIDGGRVIGSIENAQIESDAAPTPEPLPESML